MGLEPSDALADRLGVGGHPGLAEDVDDVAGPVAVGGGVHGIGRAVAPLPATERGEAPAAVGALDGPEVDDGRFPTGPIQQAVDPGRGPEQERPVVEVGGRGRAEVAPEPVEPSAGRGGGLVVVGSLADGHGGQGGPVIVVVFGGGQVAIEPVPAAVGTLDRPHPIERGAGQGVQLARRGRVVQRQGRRGRDDLAFGDRPGRLLRAVPAGGATLEERPDLGQLGRGPDHRAGHHVRVVRMAGPALPRPRPVDRDRVEEPGALLDREPRGHRLLVRVGAGPGRRVAARGEGGRDADQGENQGSTSNHRREPPPGTAIEPTVILTPDRDGVSPPGPSDHRAVSPDRDR